MILKRKKIKRNRIKIIIGSIFIIVGLSLIILKYINIHNKEKIEESNINKFMEVQEEFEKTDNVVTNIEEAKKNEKQEEYIAIIEIPKLHLKKGLYNIHSKNNVVDRNIQIIQESNFPDVENGNFILAGHSGNGSTAYFRNLYKLDLGDKINIFYNGNQYMYVVTNKYEIDKTGEATIIRDRNTTNLTLITCSQTNHTKQIVIVCDLEKSLIMKG